MTTSPKTIDVAASVGEAVELLAELDARHLPVTQQGDLVGILSDRDLRELLGPVPESAEEDRQNLESPVSHIMSAGVLCVTPEDEVSEVIDLMIEQKLGAVPVSTENPPQLVGIVSYVDILKEAKAVL